MKIVQRVPPCSGCKAEKFAQHVANPSAQLSPTSMEEILEWLGKPMEKNHPSISQEKITIPNPSLESNLHLYYPPSYTSHDSLHHDSLE